MFVGIRQIPIVTTPPDIALFERLLGDGSDLGSAIHYVAEPAPRGLADAVIVGADFIGTDPLGAGPGRQCLSCRWVAGGAGAGDRAIVRRHHLRLYGGLSAAVRGRGSRWIGQDHRHRGKAKPAEIEHRRHRTLDCQRTTKKVCTRLMPGAHFCFAGRHRPAMWSGLQLMPVAARMAEDVPKNAIKNHAPIIVAGVVAVTVSIAAAPGMAGWLGAGLALIMLAIATVDARSFIIPDFLNALGLALGMVHAVVMHAVVAEGSVAQGLAVAALRAAGLVLLFLILRLLYARARGRQGIGLGDVKLAAVAGAWLGWNAIPVAIEIAALSALAAFAIRHYAFRRPVRATTRLPFGLFFAPAIWLGWLLEATVLPYWYG
jgi:leader peptidase (prepilin peptidase) / N-methyltransferase